MDKDAPWDGVCGDTQDYQLFAVPRHLRQVHQGPRGLAPNHALHSRFLVLVALQAAHLTHIHVGHVNVCVDHKLILANAGKRRLRVRLGAGGGIGQSQEERSQVRE